MTPFTEGKSFSPWEDEGRRQALSLDGCGFVVVIGDDATAAAEVALGMARVQARRRRVVVADAVGLLSPIDDLVPFDTPRGIVDVFVRGAPLTEVVHAVDPAGNLHVLPSGPGVLDVATLLRSERWARLTEEFRGAEALLVVVAPDRELALEAVLPLVDGVVLVGRAQPLVGARVLAHVNAPGFGNLPAPRTSTAQREIPAALMDMPALKPQSRPGAVQRVTSMRPPTPPPPPRSRSWLMALMALALLGVGGWWIWRHRAVPPTDTPQPVATGGSVRPDSAAAATVAPIADTTDRSASWAVVIGAVTSTTGANSRIAQDVIKDLPAITYAPGDDSVGNRSFRIIAGAFRDRTSADSLLAALRSQKVVSAAGGAVMRLPYAVLVQSGLTRDDASFYMAGLRSKGLPVYQMIQDDGTLRLYAGAFAAPADADLLVSALRANGEKPGVTYRTGRAQ